MKIVNTAIVTTLLAMGLAGNAMAAPHHGSDRDQRVVKKVFVNKAAPQRSSRHTTVKRAAPKKVVKRVVTKKVAPKRVAKRVVTKRVVKKAYNRTYRVRPGDTLSRIAARNRVSLSKLIKLNGLWGNRANNLRVGMVIRLA